MPGFSVLQTNRELLNKITGIDLFVSDYQEIPHRIKKTTYLYHVIVVTNLFYYKIRGVHKETENVQFMVSKSFEEFKELYEKLYDRFPSVIFPSIPAQSLIKSNKDEELECMKEVLKIVAATQKLCSSPMVIKFLRGDAISKTNAAASDLNENQENNDIGVTKQRSEADDKALSNGKIASEETEEVDLFSSNNKSDVKSSEVDGEINVDLSDSLTTKTSLFDGDDEVIEVTNRDSFITATQEESVESTPPSIFDDDDDDDLLNVKEDVDDIFSLIKTSTLIKPQTKPQVPCRQRSLSKPSKDENEAGEDFFKKARTTSIKREKKESKNLDDIFSKSNKSTGLFDNDTNDDELFNSNVMAYIQQEQETDDVTLDLS